MGQWLIKLHQVKAWKSPGRSIRQPFMARWSALAALLGQIQVPVLIVIGKKDIQVDWQADGEPLQRAAAGKDDVTFLFPDNANHIQKHEPKSRAELTPAEVVAGYNAPDTHLDEEALTGILKWLAAHT